MSKDETHTNKAGHSRRTLARRLARQTLVAVASKVFCVLPIKGQIW